MRLRVVARFMILYVLIIITACSNNPSDKHNVPTNDDQNQVPPTITMYVSDQALEVPESVDRFVNYMNDITNVRLKITYLPHSQYLNQLNLKFASGEFPDVFQLWSGPERGLINGEKVLALNELIDQYGANMKRVIPQAAWDAVTVRGKIYAIPQPTETKQGQVMYIRKDWLDKLDLEIPTTSDELLDVMRAFRSGDPNNNGLTDEIPFTMREKLEWGETLFGMWGIGSRYTETYYENELIFGSAHPYFATGLQYLNTMYEEELLDREFLMNTLSIWDQKIASGNVGIWSHAPRLAWRWQQVLSESIPDQQPEVIVIPTPRGAGYDGAVGTRWGIIDKTYVISQNASDPVAIIKYFDWLFSEEGQRFTEYGIEGVTYTKSGNSYSFNDEHANMIDFLQKVYAVHGLNEEAETAILNNPQAYEKLKDAYEVANSQGFVSETIGMPSIENDYNLHSLYIEAAALVITGTKPPASYMEFISTWRQNGGQKLIDERTAWYRENRLKP
jgi:putative aldouronate transport system substrate-binding protein